MFREWYGAYYNTVAKILKEASGHPVTRERVREIIREQAFLESVLTVEPALFSGRWPFLSPDGRSRLGHVPDMPLSLLQKRWLKAIFLDPRIQLFECGLEGLEGIEPLFVPEDLCVFDQYADGDPYGEETYIQHFRFLLHAIREHRPLAMDVANRRGTTTHMDVVPEYLEYSEKDDKFRLVTSGCHYGRIINLAKIRSIKYVEPGTEIWEWAKNHKGKPVFEKESVVFELYDGRNTLERALLHFAHFEKRAEHICGKRYRVRVVYNREDETELVIRVLSFGPFLRVVEPEHFVGLIRKRLKDQSVLTGFLEEGGEEDLPRD
ncbi:MAG: WYL domain-containing protein [Lachnospiraceae bacterium]|nr:WYL domain-containing protein [Lachnospiraceae bacterium]